MESKTETQDVPLHGPALAIVKKFGPALSDVLHSKFGCVATIHGVDFESDSAVAHKKKTKVVQEKRFSVELNKGVKLSVWKADLTDFKVDAVVNAANSKLQHDGGLALALSEAGGPTIQQECKDYIKKKGELDTGGTFIGKSGLLPCNYIIHAVGPHLASHHHDVKKAEPLLKKAIWGILDRVKEKRIKTVAIPAISSGLFNYPLDRCAMTIVSTVKRYYEENSSRGHLPDEIMLVNHDEPTVKAMERACNQIITRKMSYSQVAGTSRTTAAKHTTFTIEIGNVLVTLMKGHLEEQQTDVIVNTISTNRDLWVGKISSALVTKAGPGMQQEVNAASLNGCVIATRGYLLHCREVYHFACPEVSRDIKQEILHNLVLDCLMRAASSKHTSISFPAIGTGAHGLDKTAVAFKMCKAVFDFTMQSHLLMKVFFVIFPSDDNIFQAFEKEMKRLQQETSHLSSRSPTQANEIKGATHDIKPPMPLISLMSHHEEAIHEAKKWLKALFFNLPNTVHIYNNFIQHFGEQEYMQLTCLNGNGVHLQENFMNGHASIAVKGHFNVDVVVAALQVEEMLCNVQKEFVLEENNILNSMSSEKMSNERKLLNPHPLFSNLRYDFQKNDLQMLKAEEIKNPALEKMFELKKEQLKVSKTFEMFQRIPVQFCEMVRLIGFHAEFAPPNKPEYGEGIYFANNVDAAMKLWQKEDEEYLYFVVAKVLIGRHTHGKPGLILPPALEAHPQDRYDSVTGDDVVAVIFSGYQALPLHIITCKRMLTKGSLSSV